MLIMDGNKLITSEEFLGHEALGAAQRQKPQWGPHTRPERRLNQNGSVWSQN